MYITELGKINKSQERKKTAKTSASGFSELLSSTEIENAQSSEIPVLNAKNALFFLQEEDYDAPQRKQAVNQGFDAIKYLDKIRASLLSGTISYNTIAGLESVLEKFRKNFSDTKLLQIIDEIELRSKVEIAKLHQD